MVQIQRKYRGVKTMCIIQAAVEKHEEEQEQEALRQRLEVLFVSLNGITDNNVYVSVLETLGATPHLDECKQQIKKGGNTYMCVSSRYEQNTRSYLSIYNIQILESDSVPDTHGLLCYFVCKV